MAEGHSGKSSDTSVLRGTVVVFTVMLASKLAAFISEAVLANYLGTSSIGDAYYMVSGIQQVLYPMLSVGIWKIFLPRYKALMTTKGQDDADKLGHAATVMFLGLAVAFSALLMLASGLIVSVVAPGFDEDTAALCSRLVAMTSPMYIFIIWASIYATMLQCHGKFLGSQIREIFTHIPIIAMAVFFYGSYGVYALAGGLVLGGIARLVIELPFMNWGYKPALKVRGQKDELIAIVKAMPSALAASGADEIAILINKIMASFQGTGAVSALNYASKLQNVFNGLFSKALITAAYPKMAEYAAADDPESLNALLLKSIEAIATFLIPVMLGSIVFSTDIVALVFQRGAFGGDATGITAGIYRYYALGLMFSALFSLFNNAFYVLLKSNLAMVASILCMLVNVLASIILSSAMGAEGLAAAASLSCLVSSLVQGAMLRRLTRIRFKGLLPELAKISAATFLSLAVVCPLSMLIESLALRMAAVIGFACCVYLFALNILKANSVSYIRQVVKARVRRTGE